MPNELHDALGEIVPSGVEIREVPVDLHVQGPEIEGSNFRVAQYEATIWQEDVAYFRIHAGQQLDFEVRPGSDKDSVVLLAEASAVPLVWAQRGYLVLEGSAVQKGGRVTALLGKVPCGKSGLCAGLSQRGWNLVCDGQVVVEDRGSVPPGLQRGLPRMALRPDLLELLRISLDNTKRLRPEIGRYWLESECREEAVGRLDAVIVMEPRWDDEGEWKWQEPRLIRGRKKLNTVGLCAYRSAFLRSRAAAQSFFPTLLSVVSTASVYSCETPRRPHEFLPWVNEMERWLNR